MKLKLSSAILPLITISIIAFAMQIIFPNLTNSFALVSSEVISRPWILLTSMFLHANFSHIFFNMYGLFMFGHFLEQKVGARRFLLIYLLSGIFAAFVSSFFYESALGASGAIMGIIGALIILMPELRLLFFFIIPMPLWVAGIIWALMDAFGVFFPSSVGNIAHLAGMGFGLLFGLYLRGKKQKFRNKFNSKSHLESDDIEDYLKSGRL